MKTISSPIVEMMMRKLHDIQQLAASSIDLSPESLGHLFCNYVLPTILAVYGTKYVVAILGRVFGFYHPNLMRKWPRLPWRGPFKIWINLVRWHERVFLTGKRATGGFAGLMATLVNLYRDGEVLIARASFWDIGLPHSISIKVKRHLMMYGMTGSGKTSLLATMLRCWNGSAFVIDADGQLVRLLAARDPRQWVIFDPYLLSVSVSACFNAIDCVKEAMARSSVDAAVLWALRIAEAIVVTAVGSRTPYFYDVARQFLAGLILHVITVHPERDHNLPFIRDLIVHGYRVYDDDGSELTQGSEAHDLLLRAMKQNPAYDGAIAGAASAMASASGETGGNVRSTLQDQTKFLDIPEVRKVMRESTLLLSELKARDDVVFVFAAQLTSLREELSRASRLLMNMTTYTFESVKEHKGLCLMIADELASQKYNPVINLIFAAGRRWKLVFFGATQSVEQTKANDPQGYKTYHGEADAVIWQGINHLDNAATLSEILGKKSLVEKDPRSGRSFCRDIPVMDAEQIKRYLDPNGDNVIVTRAGARPIRGKNEPYFKALPVWQYAPDPDYGDNFFRRIGRWLFDFHRPEAASPVSEKPIPPEQVLSPDSGVVSNLNPFEENHDSSTNNIIPFDRDRKANSQRGNTP